MQGLRTTWGTIANGDIPESSVCTSGLPKIIEVFLGGCTRVRPRTSLIAGSCTHRQGDLRYRVSTFGFGTRWPYNGCVCNLGEIFEAQLALADLTASKI